MVIDSSAILSIYFQEPTAAWVSQQMDAANRLLMSTVNLAESLMRMRDKQPAKADELELRLLSSKIEFIAPDVAQATLAARARLQYPLNLGDCFAYALAKTQGLALLSLDRDFRNTDIQLLLPPQAQP
jgi:ribonuclease VapC